MKTSQQLLIINNDKTILRNYAKFFYSHGYTILISDKLKNGKLICLDKKPEIILIFVGELHLLKIDIELLATSCKKLIIVDTNKNIEFDSNPNTILLQDNLITEEQVLLKIKKTPQSLKTKKILVLLVEDNELNQIYFGEILKKIKINYLSCDGQNEALKILNTNKIDLIISDVNLKDGNGIELLRQINEKSNKQIPFVIISGYTKEELIQEYGNFSSAAFLTKPIDETKFSATISNCLGIKNQISINKQNRLYNCDQIYQLLKNDKNKILISFNEFKELLSNTEIALNQAMNQNDLEIVRTSFHEILNLASYFGAEYLYELIISYRASKDFETKLSYLKKIQKELISVNNFYKKYKIQENIQ